MNRRPPQRLTPTPPSPVEGEGSSAQAGHGVALGRSPLVKDLIRSGELVAQFKSSADPARAYFAIMSPNAAGRPEVSAFVEWLKGEAAKR